MLKYNKHTPAKVVNKKLDIELWFYKTISYDYTQFDCCFKKNCRKNDKYFIFLNSLSFIKNFIHKLLKHYLMTLKYYTKISI